MRHSLNEIEALAKRAARGAGLSWGLAEEAAKGTRWLSYFGFPGVELLTALLQMNDRRSAVDFSPMVLSGTWCAPAGRMSPLIAGAALSDCAVKLRNEVKIKMENVNFPLLTVPFMGGAALRLEQPVCARWGDVQITTDGQNLCLVGDENTLLTDLVDEVVFETPTKMTSFRPPAFRATVSAEAWKQLGEFAHRTYAPSTDESRLRGAGAGLNDND